MTTDPLPMFIPRGKAVHENLATSYVRVDALVADLGEGGFSGVVEVVLRDTDSFVVINSGSVAGVVERRGQDDSRDEQTVERPEPDPGAASYTRTTLSKLAERSRLERGRVSIYGYSTEKASAVARRINAKSLYVGLSTDFTDLEKMILKLVRERDREWFVDINIDGVPTALIHMQDGACRILNSEEAVTDEESDSLDSENNKALGKLLYECNQTGTTFDVYFSRAGEAADAEAEIEADVEAEPVRIEVQAEPISGPPVVEMLAKGAHANAHTDSNQWQAAALLDPFETVSSHQDSDLVPPDLMEDDFDRHEEKGGLYNVRATAANHPVVELAAEESTHASEKMSPPDAGLNLIEAASFDPTVGTQRLRLTAESEAMTEVKRLMGEIARTIEEASQAVDRPESFSMSLRAGQIKVADRYPFLDPFAGEIEYLTGEIVFVGHATVEEFIEGLTEAIILAVQAVLKATAYPDRFRAYVTEDLKKLLTRERQPLEALGLDKVIEQIILF